MVAVHGLRNRTLPPPDCSRFDDFRGLGLLTFLAKPSQNSIGRQRHFALPGASTIFVSWPRQSPSLWALMPTTPDRKRRASREALERDKREVAQANFLVGAKSSVWLYSYTG
jgi:hypothetical protein